MTILEQYSDQINAFRDHDAAISWFISLGESHSVIQENLRVPKNYVRGCCPDCKVWCTAECTDNIWKIIADSDSKQLKSLCKILTDVYTGKTASEIKNIKYKDFYSISKVLNREKQKGLQSLINRVHNLVSKKLD